MDGNQSNQVQSNVKNNERTGRGLFYGVVAVAIVIVMAVGATFAYFAASTQSAGSTVSASSATVNLKFISYETGWMSEELIPAATNVVGYSFEIQNDTTARTVGGKVANSMCKDDAGNSVCSVFVFQVYNSAGNNLNVNISLESTSNDFSNLYAMIYELTLPSDLTDYNDTETANAASYVNGFGDPNFRQLEEDEGDSLIDVKDLTKPDGENTLLYGTSFGGTYQPIYVNRKGVVKTMLGYEDNGNRNSSRDLIVPTSGDSVVLATDVLIKGTNELGSESTGNKRLNTFALVLYIHETGDNQTNDDADSRFTGMIHVDPADGNGNGVTGQIAGSEGFHFADEEESGGSGNEGGSGNNEPGNGGEPSNGGGPIGP